MPDRVGLAISGGSAKGAFGAGFMFRLFVEFPQVPIEVIGGTSTGALIGPMVAKQIAKRVDDGDLFDPANAQHDLVQLRTLYTQSDWTDFFEPGPNRTSSQINAALGPMAAMLLDALTKGHALTAHGLEVLVDTFMPDAGFYTDPQHPILVQATFGMLRQGVYYFRSDRLAHRPLMKLATRASAHQPVLMPLVEITTDDENLPADGTPRYTGTDWYGDGGVMDYAPIRGVAAAGATKILVIVHRHLDDCREQTNEKSACLQDANGNVRYTETPGAADAFGEVFGGLVYGVGSDDQRAAVIASQLHKLVAAVKAKTSDPQRSEILSVLDPPGSAPSGTRNPAAGPAYWRRLGLQPFLEGNFVTWTVMIPNDEPLPSSDLDFSRRDSLFDAGQQVCVQELNRGLRQWLT